MVFGLRISLPASMEKTVITARVFTFVQIYLQDRKELLNFAT